MRRYRKPHDKPLTGQNDEGGGVAILTCACWLPWRSETADGMHLPSPARHRDRRRDGLKILQRSP
eukprot:1581525-Prymnesium_polylepis.1